MLRRAFLQSVGKLVGIRAPLAPAGAQGKRIMLQPSPLAGIQYHAGESKRSKRPTSNFPPANGKNML